MPSGVWSQEEYEKLPPYDERETVDQPPAAFMCHQQDGRLCAGWVAVHDMQESLGFRFFVQLHDVTEEQIDAILDYETNVPLFSSGQEAADHGMRELLRPQAAARKTIEKIERRRKA